MISILEAQERSIRGPLMPELEFDKKYQRTLREVADKWCRQHFKLSPQELIPVPESGDAVYEAALELIARVGLYHINTHRVIEFTRQEIDETAKSCGRPYTLGEGREQVTIKPRFLGDPSIPPNFPGPGTTTVSEEYFVPLHASIIKQPEVNGVCPGSLVKVGGFENKIGTAGELMNVFHEVRLLREAIQRAGRPGFVIGEAPAAAVSPFALIAAFSQGYYSRTDTHMPMHLYPGLKFDWERLILAAYARQMAIHPITCHMEVLGINVRDPWEAAIADVGGSMAYLSINGAHGTHGAGYSKGLDQDMRYNLQAKTLKNLALTRNGPVCCIGMSFCMGGECSKGASYGNAFLSLGETASGAALMVFSSYAQDRSAGLAAKMAGEATIAAAGLEREEANKILNGIASLIDGVEMFDMGKTFPECYDVEKAEPTDENKRVYAEAKKDLREVGVTFKY